MKIINKKQKLGVFELVEVIEKDVCVIQESNFKRIVKCLKKLWLEIISIALLTNSAMKTTNTLVSFFSGFFICVCMMLMFGVFHKEFKK